MQCGRPGCGGHLGGQWTRGTEDHRVRLQACRGVSIRAEHVEPLLYGIVAGRLAMPDAIDLLKAELHDEAEAEALRLGAGDVVRPGWTASAWNAPRVC